MATTCLAVTIAYFPLYPDIQTEPVEQIEPVVEYDCDPVCALVCFRIGILLHTKLGFGRLLAVLAMIRMICMSLIFLPGPSIIT